MKLSEAVKPISYIKAHASEVLREVSKNKKSFIITQNGEAKAILQDLESYEQDKDTMALLKILALSNRSIKKGKYRKMEDVFSDLELKIAEDEANEI